MKTITLMNHKLHLYWKKMATLVVIGSLLVSFFIPPFACAYLINKQSKAGEVKQANPEDFKLRKALLTMTPEKGEEKVIQLAQRSIDTQNLPEIMEEYRSRFEEVKNAAKLDEVANGANNSINLTSKAGARTIFNRIFAKSNLNAVRKSNMLLRASKLVSVEHFKKAAAQISALHAGDAWGLVQMFHRLNAIHNLPRSFWYSFNTARRTTYEKPEDRDYKTEWWYVKEVIASNIGNVGRDLIAARVEMYAEKYKVDEKANRTVDGKEIAHLDEDEIALQHEFNTLFLDSFNTAYKRLLLKNNEISFFEGPGMVYGEDDFLLAYLNAEEMYLPREYDSLGEIIPATDTRDPNSTFRIDRRFARAIINLGKEKGISERRKIVASLVERELIVQSYMDVLIREGKDGNEFNLAHEAVLEFPGQKELLEFATKVALEIRFGNVPDYNLVKEMIETMFSAEQTESGNLGSTRYPDDLPNDFTEYLHMLYDGGKKGTEGYAKALHEIFSLMKKDFDLYLEYKTVVEKILLLTRASFKAANTAMFPLFPVSAPLPKVPETLDVIKGIFEQFRLNMGNWHYYKTLAMKAIREKYQELKGQINAQKVVGFLIIGVSSVFVAQLPVFALGFSGEVLSAKALIDIAPFFTGALGLALVYPTSTDAEPYRNAPSINLAADNGDSVSRNTANILGDPLPKELTSIYHSINENIEVSNIRLLPNIKDIPSLLPDLEKFIDDAESDEDTTKNHEILVVSDYNKLMNEVQVLDYLGEKGIRSTSRVKIRILHHPLESDGTFNLQSFIEVHKDKLLSDGFSLRILNKNNFWSYVKEVLRNAVVVNGIDLIELNIAGKEVTEASQ